MNQSGERIANISDMYVGSLLQKDKNIVIIAAKNSTLLYVVNLWKYMVAAFLIHSNFAHATTIG